MKPISIRFRLTAWYFAVLAATFCLFGVGTFLALRQSMNEALDEGLHERLRGVNSFLESQPPGESPEDLKTEFKEFSGLIPARDPLVVNDDQGNLIYQSGSIDLRRTADQRFGTLDKPLFATVRAGTQPVRIVLASVSSGGQRYTILLGTPIGEFYEVLERFQWLALSALPVVLLLASLGGYWMSRKALRPVDEIIESACSISAQSLSQRLSVPKTNDELQRLCETLNDMIDRLEKAFKKITRFTADASHELRTPVALVRTTAELSLRKRRSEEEYRQALEQILTEVERTTNLIENLMTLARADSGAEALQRSRIDLVPILEEVCSRSQSLADAKQILFERKIPERSIRVQGDVQALRSLFLILIDNAIKYTESGGKVSFSLYGVKGFAVGEISDSGIGIAPEDLPHIFERFYRADKARSRDHGGTGLGLSIAQWIADAQGAAIEVESTVGKGSRFRVRIPIAEN